MNDNAQQLVASLRQKGIKDTRVLDAISKVPRQRFVGLKDQALAYGDHPLSIGFEQTISQPYIVALMSELARVKPGDSILEIGTGSGYQAAVLAELGATVWSLEIIPELGIMAARLLNELGYHNVNVKVGDGYDGWMDKAPFDAIVVTAAPLALPQAFVSQLRDGGRIVIPIGDQEQELKVYTKESGRLQEQHIVPVRFVPMTGKTQPR